MSRSFILEGAAARYMQMFSGLPTSDPKVAERINNSIQWAKTLKKNDRILWYLRYIRAHLDQTVAQTAGNEQIAQKLNARFAEFSAYIGAAPAQASTAVAAVMNRSFRTNIEHFMSLPIHTIQNVVWDKQQPEALLQEFRRLEQEWKAKREQYIDMRSDDQAEPVMEFPDGYAWFNLNRPSCRIEGDAMGHCGNTAAETGIVWSLRHRDSTGEQPKHMWRPVATFIVHEDGYIGEMKGRDNIKPDPMYHKYIVALLKHEHIKGIRGGGHDPANNFSIHDLEDDDEKEELLRDKPELAGGTDFASLYKKCKERFDHPDMIRAIKDLDEEMPGKQYSGGGSLIPYDYKKVKIDDHEYILMDQIATDFDGMVSDMADLVPQIEMLKNLKDEIEEMPWLSGVPHESLDDESTLEFYNSLSEHGQEWVDKHFGISHGMSHQLHLNDLTNAITSGQSPEFSRMFDKAVHRILGDTADRYTVEKIDARLKEYIDTIDYVGLPNMNSTIVVHDEGYFVALTPSAYLEFLEEANAMKTDGDNYDDNGSGINVGDVMYQGWFSTEYHSNQGDDSHAVDQLKEKGLIKPIKKTNKNDTHGYDQYRFKGYIDTVYGEGANFDVDAPQIAKQFDSMIDGASTTGPQDDDKTAPLDLKGGHMNTKNLKRKNSDDPFTEALAQMRRRAGICG